MRDLTRAQYVHAARKAGLEPNFWGLHDAVTGTTYGGTINLMEGKMVLNRRSTLARALRSMDNDRKRHAREKQ